MSHVYLTRAMLSDHQRRQIAEQEAADFCAIGIVCFLVGCFVLGAILMGMGV